MSFKVVNRFIITLVIIAIVGFFSLFAFEKNIKNFRNNWAVDMADSEIARSPEAWMLDFSKTLRWNFANGIVCKAMLDVYYAGGHSKYYEYVKAYADTMIHSNGRITGYKVEEYNLDRLTNGVMLLELYKIEAADEYKTAIELLRSQLQNQPRTSNGGFWHKMAYPNQVWLDGIYMSMPFYAGYGALFNDSSVFNDVALQFNIANQYLLDSVTGLYRQGWDESRQQQWSNSETGQSAHNIGKSVGFLAMALVDVLDYFPLNHNSRTDLENQFAGLAKSLVSYQNPQTGLWNQILNYEQVGGNIAESSASSMIVYSLLKGIRMGYIHDSYSVYAQKGYEGIIRDFIIDNNDSTITITHGVESSALGGKPYRDGSFDYYVNCPVRNNDPKSVGAFIMASVEWELRAN